MRLKKTVEFIDLMNTDEEKCDQRNLQVKQFKWCMCMESISISDVNKQPADSSNLPSHMNFREANGGSGVGGNGASAIAACVTSASDVQTKDEDNGDERKIFPDSSDLKIIDAKPR